MKKILILSCFISSVAFAQQTEIKLNPEKVSKFSKYMEFKHGGGAGFDVWKENNKMLYAQEMWYYTESFYIKRNYLNEGIMLNEEIIDITRFESQRKPNEESIVTLSGFKDVIVLLPTNKLIYKP